MPRRRRDRKGGEQGADLSAGKTVTRGAWYADPYAKAGERWWDGGRWTQAVRGEPLPADHQADSVRRAPRAWRPDAPEMRESRTTVSATPPNQKASALPPRLLASARNTATSRLTTVNYDLLIFEDKLVVVRGTPWQTMPKDVAASLWDGSTSLWDGSTTQAGGKRVAGAQKRLREELRAQDPGNNILAPAEVASVQLQRRAGIASVLIGLPDESALRYLWQDIAANGRYDDIQHALGVLFGPKLLR